MRHYLDINQPFYKPHPLSRIPTLAPFMFLVSFVMSFFIHIGTLNVHIYMKHAKSTNIHAISSHIKAYQKQVYDQNRTSNLKGLLKLLLPHELIYKYF